MKKLGIGIALAFALVALFVLFNPLRPAPTVVTYSAADTAQLDLGSRPTTFGSANQATELLQLMQQKPAARNFSISYETPDDRVAVAVNTAEQTITRIHTKHSGRITIETWTGFCSERLTAAASGGSLNDTPEGKRPGSFLTR